MIAGHKLTMDLSKPALEFPPMTERDKQMVESAKTWAANLTSDEVAERMAAFQKPSALISVLTKDLPPLTDAEREEMKNAKWELT